MATPQIVCGFPTIHILGQQGEPGQQRDSFKEWEQTSKDLPAAKHQDFAIPIFSHGVNSRDICRTVQGERGGRAPKSCATSGINQCVHCLGCPCPSALPSGCYFYITHIFFLCGPAVFMRKHPRKWPSRLSVPQQMEPCSGWRWTGIKGHRWAVGPRLGQRRV